METRAAHIWVGSFALLLMLGLVGFAIWIAKVDLDAEYKDYDIYFPGTVSGLVKRGTVFYLGIPVGDVRDITLAPDDPRKVRVHIRLKAEVPVNEGATARLEYQGLTGVAYIELNGGAPTNPLITPKGNQERPVIPSEASAFQEIFESAPSVMQQANLAVTQIKKLVSDENIASVTNILKKAEQIADNVEDGTDELDGLIAALTAAGRAIEDTARSFEAFGKDGRTLLKSDVQPLIKDAKALLNRTDGLVKRLDDLVAANSGAVNGFMNNSLPDAARMIRELEAASSALKRLMERLEVDPGGTLLGGSKPGYNASKRRLDGQEGEDK